MLTNYQTTEKMESHHHHYQQPIRIEHVVQQSAKYISYNIFFFLFICTQLRLQNILSVCTYSVWDKVNIVRTLILSQNSFPVLHVV